jgi:HEPN domain-containing protein
MAINIEDLIYFGNILKKYSLPIPEDKLKKSNDFIKCAKRDLRASKILYDKNMYAEYAYHMQQSVEKIAKAYIISLNTLSNSQYKQIRHKTPKAFIKLLEKEFEIFDILKKLDFNFNTDLTDLKNIIDNPIETQKIAMAKTNEIKNLLDEYEKTIQKVDFSSLELNNKTLKNINHASKYILDKTTVDKKSKISLKRLLRKIFTNKSVQENIMNKKLKDSSEDFIRNLLGLYFLSIITYPHEAYTRYPDGKITPFNYRKNSSISKCQNRLAKIVRNSIRVIEKDNKRKKIIR